MFESLAAWWQAGDAVMPVMLVVALVLYGRLGERAWMLFAPDPRRRALDARRQVAAVASGGARTWAARAAAVAEESELMRGFRLIRCLITCLPLLGLLGTVNGMVEAFSAIAVTDGTGSALARDAGAGIGQALAATQYGIALAVPALVAELALRRRAVRLTERHLGGLRAPLGAAG